MKRLTKVLYALTFLAVCAGALAFLQRFTQAESAFLYPTWETGAVVTASGAETPFDPAVLPPELEEGEWYRYALTLPEGRANGTLLIFETTGLDAAVFLDGAELWYSAVSQPPETANQSQAQIALPAGGGEALTIDLRPLSDTAIVPPLLRLSTDPTDQAGTIAYANYYGLSAGASALAAVLLWGLFLLGLAHGKRNWPLLLPTLAAATAASGAVTTATVQQVSTVFFVDLLLRLIRQLLLPLVYLYIGLLTAAACLPENRLGAIAEALKKLVTWILTTALLVFTIYLSIVRIISGSADSATVKVAKAAISGVVPVVGGIIADASETVLAGAGMLKNTIGVFGMLAILAACAYPFLQLGVQYLLYKLTAYLASVVGAPGLCKLIDGLGGAFGLILGMTGGCALLLLISVLASVGAVMP